MKNLTSIAEHSDYIETFCNIPEYKWQLHRKRVEFGKQTLEKWMFVACKLVDGVWVVLEEPHPFKEGDCKEQNKLVTDIRFKEYQQAKERCLFEGFEIGIYPLDVLLMRGNKWGLPIIDLHRQTIEDLVKYNLELTATAQKEIGV